MQSSTSSLGCGLSSIPVIQIRNSSAIIYQESLFKPQLNWLQRAELSARMKKVQRYSGKVTACSRKRIRKAVNLLLQISPKQRLYNPVIDKTHDFTINFITLTFANDQFQIDSRTAYQQCLRPFIQWLTKTKGVKHYVWKVELQARGQVHYHITTNVFVHHSEIKDKWNYLQRKSGLMAVTGHNNQTFEPNSTDIHSVYKVKNTEAYLCKYMSKDGSAEEGVNMPNSECETLLPDLTMGNVLSCYPANTFNDRTIDSKVWDCSASLKDNKYYSIELGTSIEDSMAQYEVQEGEEAIKTDHAMIVRLRDGFQSQLLPRPIFEDYCKHLELIKNYVRPPVSRGTIKKDMARQHIDYINSLLSDDTFNVATQSDNDLQYYQLNNNGKILVTQGTLQFDS